MLTACGVAGPEPVLTDEECVQVWATSTNAVTLDDSECEDAWLAGTCDKYCAENLSFIPSDCLVRGEELVRASIGSDSADRISRVLSACGGAAPAPAPAAFA